MPIPAIPTQGSIGQNSCGNAVNVQFNLQAMQDAFTGADETDQVAFLTAMAAVTGFTPSALVSVVNSLTVDNQIHVLETLLNTACLEGFVEPQLTLLPPGEASTFEAQCLPNGHLGLNLSIGEDVVPPVSQNFEIVSETCSGAPELIKTPVLLGPEIMGIPTSQASFFQVLMAKLDALLGCCNPCLSIGGITVDLVAGANHITGTGNVVAVKFNLTTDIFRGYFTFGDPEFGMFGKFAWDNSVGAASPVIFINSSDQEIDFPRDLNTGFRVYLNPGVTGTCTYFSRAVWLYTPP
jgi:hypothetical protein